MNGVPVKHLIGKGLVTFLVTLLILASPLAWDFVRRRQLEAAVWQTLAPDVTRLFQPSGVNELERRVSMLVNLYRGTCADGLVDITYGSARPLADIQADYEAALSASGWTLDPGYRSSDDFLVYQGGSDRQLSLTFRAPPLLVDTQVFPTVYTLGLDYTLPTVSTCFE